MNDKFNIIPAADTLVIEPAKLKDIGIVGLIEDVSSNQPQLGRVLAIGSRSHVDDDPTKPEKNPLCEVKVGSIIAYVRYGEHKFMVAGQKYLFVRLADVLGTFESKDGGKIE